MAKSVRESDLKVLNSGLPDTFPVAIEHSDGIHHWLAHKFRFSDSSGKYCVACLSFDLTQHIHADGLMEEALATLQHATRTKKDFFSQVNREQAAPLFSILSSADQWNAMGEEDEVSKQGFVDHISFGAAKLRSQVDNLMLLAETDNQTLELDITTFDCRSLVDRIARNTQRLLVDWDAVENHLIFRVEDSSIGLTPAQQQHMFTDVVAMNASIPGGTAGASIGLTICCRLSALLGADLLIVGNNLDNTGSLKNIVVGLGYQVDCVDSGEQAFTALQKQSYKLLFMHINMPIMDGITATRWIRRREINTPIIAIVNDISDDEKRRYVSWGITDFLKNPENRTDVFRVIERQVPPRQ